MGSPKCPINPELQSSLRWDEIDIKETEQVHKDTQVLKVEHKHQRGILDFYLSDRKCVYAGPFEKVMTLPGTWERLGAVVAQKRLPDNNSRFEIYIQNSLYSSVDAWKVEVMGDDFIKVYDSSLKRFQLMGRNLQLVSDTFFTDVQALPHNKNENPTFQVTTISGETYSIGSNGEKIQK